MNKTFLRLSCACLGLLVGFAGFSQVAPPASSAPKVMILPTRVYTRVVVESSSPLAELQAAYEPGPGVTLVLDLGKTAAPAAPLVPADEPQLVREVKVQPKADGRVALRLGLSEAVPFRLWTEGSRGILELNKIIRGTEYFLSPETQAELGRTARKDVSLPAVETADRSDRLEVTARLNEKCPVNIFALENPLRLVVDVIDAVLGGPTPAQTVNKYGVDRVKVGQFRTGSPYAITRIVFDLKEPRSYALANTAAGLTISLPATGMMFAQNVSPSKPEAKPVETKTAATPTQPKVTPQNGNPVPVTTAPPKVTPPAGTATPAATPPAPKPEAKPVEDKPATVTTAPPKVTPPAGTATPAAPPPAPKPEAKPVEDKPAPVTTAPPKVTPQAGTATPAATPPAPKPEAKPVEDKPAPVTTAPPKVTPPAGTATPAAPPPATKPEAKPVETKPAPVTAAPQKTEAAPPEQKTTPPPKTEEAKKEEQKVEDKFKPRTLHDQGQKYGGELLSPKFKDADLRDVVLWLCEKVGLNVIFDPDVRGTVTCSFEDVPWDQFLDYILKNNKMGKFLDGNILRIAPVGVLAEEQRQEQALRDAVEQSGPLVTKTYTLSYAKAQDVLDLMKEQKSPRGQMVIDARTNALIVRDTQEKIDLLDKLILDLDTQTPQVQIETRIVEATSNFVRNLGIQWGGRAVMDPFYGNQTSLQFPNKVLVDGAAIPQGNTTRGIGGPLGGYAINLPASGFNTVFGLSFANILDTFRLDMAVSALESKGEGRIVSSTRVTAQNNKEAYINQGRQIPVQTQANFTVTVQYVNAGLELRATPQITAEGTIIMYVEIQNNAADFANLVNGIPPITTQSAKTTVTVPDGGTTVIGGIYRIEDSVTREKVPFLHQIPLLGSLFRNSAVTKQNRELLIFITPRILR